MFKNGLLPDSAAFDVADRCPAHAELSRQRCSISCRKAGLDGCHLLGGEVFIDRLAKGSLYAPSPGQSAGQCRSCRSHLCGPVCNAHRLTIACEKPIDRLVAGLLSCRSPSAVFWRIAGGAVAPVNAVLRRWLRPHVGKEIFESVLAIPPIADIDPGASVLGVTDRALHVASAAHIRPVTKLGRLAHMFNCSKGGVLCSAT
jgi:hypothetical protein